MSLGLLSVGPPGGGGGDIQRRLCARGGFLLSLGPLR